MPLSNTDPASQDLLQRRFLQVHEFRKRFVGPSKDHSLAPSPMASPIAQELSNFGIPKKKKKTSQNVSYSPASKKVPSVVPINAPMAAKNPKRFPARSARLLQLGVVTPSLAELAAPGTPGNGPRKRRWRRREAAPAWKRRETWHEETWCVQTWCWKFPTSLLRQKKMQSILWVSSSKSSNDFKMLHNRLALNPHLVSHLRVIQ